MALNLEKANKETTPPELAATYLNLCAIHSELEQHGDAINKAAKSVMLIRNYLKKSNIANNDLDKIITQDKKSLKNMFGQD